MSTVLSATVEMKDPEKFKEYSPKAIASMEPYGGKLILRAKVEKRNSWPNTPSSYCII